MHTRDVRQNVVDINFYRRLNPPLNASHALDRKSKIKSGQQNITFLARNIGMPMGKLSLTCLTYFI